jgi:hypothetical protein
VELSDELVDEVLVITGDEVLVVTTDEVELVDEVLVITGDEVLVTTDEVELVLELVVELVTVELEDGVGGSAAQGWLDSKSVATKIFKALRPPQVSVLSPVHGMLHEVLFNGKVPLPRTTPQL